MNLWDQSGIPHKGWYCVDVIDLGDPSEKCQMCGKEDIRYVHIMGHEDYGIELHVGCVCAEKMSGDYQGPREREKKLRNRAARKIKWLTRKWRVSAKGNHFLNIEDHNLSVFPTKYGKWGYRIDSEFGKNYFKTQEEAKLALFNDFNDFLDK